MAAQIEALARSFFAHTAPTSAWAVSQEFRFWLLTHCASARSFDMVSAMTGEMVSSASSKAKPGGVLGDGAGEGDELVGVDEGEGAREGVDAAAARAEVRQAHRRNRLRAHGRAEIEIPQRPVPRRLAVEGGGSGGVDRRAPPEVVHLREDVRMCGKGERERCGQRDAPNRVPPPLNSHGRAPGR